MKSITGRGFEKTENTNGMNFLDECYKEEERLALKIKTVRKLIKHYYMKDLLEIIRETKRQRDNVVEYTKELMTTMANSKIEEQYSEIKNRAFSDSIILQKCIDILENPDFVFCTCIEPMNELHSSECNHCGKIINK